MKKFKRGAVIAAVLIFVGAAVYLNWSYNHKETELAEVSGTEQTGAKQDVAGLYYSEDAVETVSESTAGKNEKLDAIRLSRQQTRDEAKSALDAITGAEGASQEAIDAAAASVAAMADRSVKDSEIEAAIIAKGYDDCVVCITDEGITVTVAGTEDGLTSSGVAQITDTVIGNTGYSAQQIKISEVR